MQKKKIIEKFLKSQKNLSNEKLTNSFNSSRIPLALARHFVIIHMYTMYVHLYLLKRTFKNMYMYVYENMNVLRVCIKLIIFYYFEVIR